MRIYTPRSMVRSPRFLAPDAGPWPVRLARWIARAASLASLALLALFATSGGAAPSGYEWLLIAFFPIGVALGMVVAWRYELLGGAITLAGLGGFHALLLLDAARPASGPWFAAFGAPGLVLGACGLHAQIASRAARRR